MDQMSPRKALLPALAVVLALPAIALAGHPSPGGHYEGESGRGDVVVLAPNKHGHHMYAMVTDPCGNILRGTRLTVGSKGRFDAVSDDPKAELKGRFLGRRKAVGTFRNGCKGYGERRFVVHRR
jgi:hypothetical protein